jgi:hypothetical protein
MARPVVYNRTGWCSGNALNLSWKSTRFESRPRYRLSRPGVGNLRPAGRMWPLQTFYAACRMIWELANAGREKNLCY